MGNRKIAVVIMINGTISPSVVTKRFLFWKYDAPNFNRMSCMAERGTIYWLERDEAEIRFLDYKEESIASCELTDRLVRKDYIHKRISLPISGTDIGLGTLSFEKGQSFLEIAGNRQLMPGNVPGDNRNGFCGYHISMNFSKVEFQCVDDQHLAAVILGIYATVLRLAHRNTNPT